MNPEFSIDELKMIHLAMISRERIIREDRIPDERDSVKVAALTAEADALRSLGRKACAAQLSKELGFEIQPFVDA